VLGVNARTGELTLLGSVVYKGTPAATDKRGDGDADDATLEFGEKISDDPVYVVYFKWGSLIGTSSDLTDTQFGPEDIAWAPEQYNVKTLLASIHTAPADASVDQKRAEWSKIPVAETSAWPATDAMRGLGDPCVFADGGEFAEWKMPTGGPWGDNVGAPFGTIGFGGDEPEAKPETLNWVQPNGARYVVKDATNNLPVNGAVAGNGSSEDWSMFLPAAGQRSREGGITDNIDHSKVGNYWTSTYESATSRYNIDFGQSTDRVNDDDYFTKGFAIRCVPKPLAYVHASPGVIGIRHDDLMKLRSGEYTVGDGSYGLTLAGSSIYKGTDASTSATDQKFGELETQPVYVVYFKWGSMVGMVGEEGDEFDSGDVVWVNEDFNRDYLFGYDAFTASTYLTIGEDSDYDFDFDIDNSRMKGHGDICAEFGSWRTPGSYKYLENPYGTWNGWSPSDITSADVVNDIPTNSGSVPNGGLMLPDGTFLPAAGYRYTNGKTIILDEITKSHSNGFYSSSSLFDAVNLLSLTFKSKNGSGTAPATGLDANISIPVRCVEIPPLWGGENHLLYFDPNDNNRLKVGRWGEAGLDAEGRDLDDARDVEVINSIDNLAFTKFGSMIVFTSSTNYNKDTSTKFTPNGNTYSYASIPNYGTRPDQATFPLVSSPAYHNAENLDAGRGDICKLVGLTSAEAAVKLEQGTLDDYVSGWRLPTMAENRMFVGLEPDDNSSNPESGSSYYTASPGPWNASNIGIATILRNPDRQGITIPATGPMTQEGFRDTNFGSSANYWSSEASNSTSARGLAFNWNYLMPSNGSGMNYGFSVRCVWDADDPRK
jgi:uncharacterized protein (TIGR02145 family)